MHCIEYPVEFTLASILPTHKDKDMVDFDNTYDPMKENLDEVDENIDTFINIWRHRWDMCCFIFYGDPIYDIEGTFQMKSRQISPLED
jgi:hypothetical protein